MTIAQIVYDNELHFGLTDQDIREKVTFTLSKINFWCSHYAS